jgi:hypothetical protein
MPDFLHPVRLSRRTLLAGAGAGVVAYAVTAAGGAPSALDTAVAAIGPGGTPFTGKGKGGLLVQSAIGANGHFEVAVPSTVNGLDTLTRDNDAGVWRPMVWTANTAGTVVGAAALWSNYGTAGHLELVVVAGGRVHTWWRDDAGAWHGLGAIPGITDATGWPGFVQSDFGTPGNFELVVPSSAGGFLHTSRLNDTGVSWSTPTRFGTGTYRGVSLIQSSFLTNGHGNLEMVAVSGNTLSAWWRGASTWGQSATIATNVDGAPALVQSTSGTPGNFEVVAPLLAGGLGHWSRANSTSGYPWSAVTAFGGTVRYRAAGLVAGPLGPARDNLEVVGLRLGATTIANRFYRQAGAWTGATTFWSRATSGSTTGTVGPLVNIGIQGIHAVLLSTGQLLLWGFVPGNDGANTAQVRRVTPGSTFTVTTLPDAPQIFCAGQALLPNGKVLVAGGHNGATINAVHVFAADGSTVTRHGTNLNAGRWYPTVTVLADGRAMILGGSTGVGVSPGNAQNSTYQIFDDSKPAAEKLGAAVAVPVPFSPTWPGTDQAIHWYPFVFQLPDGRVFVHSRSTTRFLTVSSGTWSAPVEALSRVDRTYPHEGSAVLLPLRHNAGYAATVLVTGGSSVNPGAFARVAQTVPATATCELLTVAAPGQSQPGWRAAAPMAKPRLLHDLVLLPDGTVLAVGGSGTGASDHGANPVAEVEVYDPAAGTGGTWRTLAKMSIPRGYHATAALLPDGSVAVAGRDSTYQPEPLKYVETRLEVFKPPYFSRGTRPTLSGVPAQAGYGATAAVSVTVASGSTLRDVVLVRAGGVTHGNNMDQRMVTLAFTGTGSVTVTMPPNARVAPPGSYLMFAVDSQGRPSTASMIRLG